MAAHGACDACNSGASVISTPWMARCNSALSVNPPILLVATDCLAVLPFLVENAPGGIHRRAVSRHTNPSPDS